jgi:hypothetical protein
LCRRAARNKAVNLARDFAALAATAKRIARDGDPATKLFFHDNADQTLTKMNPGC